MNMSVKKKEIAILYEDEQLLVCVKPAGVASQGGGGFQTDLTDMLKLHIREESKAGGGKGEPYLGVIHRLDQPVGGVMVYAKEPVSAARLSTQVSDGEMGKRYLAVLENRPERDTGVLKDYLFRDARMNMSRVVADSQKNQRGVKPAELSYRILESRESEGKELFLAEIELKTGRHHQIRVQFAHAGCPLWGDMKYNSSSKGRELALFSYYLKFTHPATGERMEFSRKPSGGIFDLFL